MFKTQKDNQPYYTFMSSPFVVLSSFQSFQMDRYLVPQIDLTLEQPITATL